MRLIEVDDRYPEFWLTYKRLQSSNVDPYTPMGPNYDGEWLWPVEVEKNQIGFSLAPPGE